MSPAEWAFETLADHCVHCPACRVDADSTEVRPECTTAAALYQTWHRLWRAERR